MDTDRFLASIRPLPTDLAIVTGSAAEGSNLCSRCQKPISEDEIPILMWPANG